MIKIILIAALLVLTNCQKSQVIKTHGIAFLEKRQEPLKIRVSNTNDVRMALGNPSTEGVFEDSVWIYIERTLTRGKLLNLGQNVLLRNNVLVLRFDKYGILNEKKLYNKHEMKKLKFSPETTEKLQKDKDFIYSFLSSVRQKMFANSNKKK